jgi:phage tail sheath protein FI
MYGNRNAINPIVQFADFQDFVVWGQKTLQRRPTALDRVNVRRMMFVIEKRIRAASRQLLFDPNDEIFRQRFVQIASTILDEVVVGRGITDYIIQADEELNTPDVIDRNEFRARIGVQPTRAVEFIFIEFSIHRTGSFTENADNF